MLFDALMLHYILIDFIVKTVNILWNIFSGYISTYLWIARVMFWIVFYGLLSMKPWIS